MDQEKQSSEKILIEDLRQGKTKAFEKTYRKSLLKILSFVYLNSGQEVDAADLLQEAIIVLYENLQKPEFNLTCKATTYVYSICRNKWLNKLRAKRLLMETYGIFEPEVNIIDVSKYLDIPDLGVDEAQIELEEKLKLALDLLDYPCKDILIKFYFYNQNLEEIAQAINYSSANAVKVRKFRCMQKLKDGIKQ